MAFTTSPKDYYTGRVPRQAGYLGQPQNSEPMCAPCLAVRLTIAVPHFGQVGAAPLAAELTCRGEGFFWETSADFAA